jgi:GTP cyclohydrolase I
MTITHPDIASSRLALPDGAADHEAAVAAAETFLTALGLRLDTDHTRRTAERMAVSYAELLSPRQFDATTFPTDEAHQGMVVARSVSFASLCAHHLLPFVGTATVGYLPGARLLGLSKLARVVEMFAGRLQVQEKLTGQLAAWLEVTLPCAKGIGVIVSAEHLCTTVRGVRALGSSVVTTAWRGRFVDDPAARAEFLSLAEVGR